MIWWWYWIVVGVVCLLIFLFFLFLYLTSERISPINVNGAHVIVTGGSSGIGLEVAKQFASLGAHVTIFARKQNVLDEAVEVVKKYRIRGDLQNVLGYSVDVSDAKAVEVAVQRAALANENRVNVLITSAGVSRPGKLEDVPIEQYKSLNDINLLGTIYCARAVVPFMKKQNGGRMVFVSSMAGLVGVVGFSAYTPGKFAVRGLAETLHMELKPHNIYVSVSYPPDVDTPMLKDELQHKPLECKIISEGSGLWKPEVVAKDIVDSVTKKWKFFILQGMDGILLQTLCCGFSPSPSALESLRDIFLLPLTRLISLGYLKYFDSVCKKVHRDQNGGGRLRK